jgi:hypothetical protein
MIEMRCKCLTISWDLDKKFRDTIVQRKELKKGCLRECVEEAIKDWISKNDDGDLYGYA